MYPETWKIAEPKTPQQTHTAESCPSGQIQLYAVSAGGASVDPLAAVRRKGFDVGACVAEIDGDTLYMLAVVGWQGSRAHVILELWNEGCATHEASRPQQGGAPQEASSPRNAGAVATETSSPREAASAASQASIRKVPLDNFLDIGLQE